MADTEAYLDRRAALGRELLSAHVPSKLMAELVDFRLSGPGRLSDIPFPTVSKSPPSPDPVTDRRSHYPTATRSS
jgi:hypothetical protein